ncbi:cysteine desulfurase family protein [Nocardioides cynanchi]|uniref:cysteine desulfurase family protein n=1 Tax=Nocardioides cynanchi TaxID=2558918 RepID=UPI001247D822|nr:aminotransferase class V-fold PLP-dependent enzyme [Nocardioides cynanchi]
MSPPERRRPAADRVFLDTASGEALHPAARKAWVAALDGSYADPRRLHHEGRTARLLLDNARAVTAEALGVRADEVTFTASGTDAVHRGLLGLHRGGGRRGDTVVHTAVEHSAVLEAARWSGAPSRVLPVDHLGRLRLDEVDVTSATVVACQSANHEVGTIQPVAALAERVGDVPLLVDASASAGRMPLPDGWSAVAASAHKWGGPAGVGVLVVRRGARWREPFPADDRTDPRATGFENVPAIFAAAAALQAVVADRDTENRRQRALVDRVRAAAAALPETEVVGDPDDRVPHLVTFSCLYLDGEALVTELDRRGFAVASGSACTASTLEPSHVLAAMGALTHGNVRVSVGRDTSAEDVELFLAALPGVVAELRGRVR